MAEMADFLTVTKGSAGWFVVHMRYYPDEEMYDVHTTGNGRYETEADAVAEAHEWSASDGIAFLEYRGDA